MGCTELSQNGIIRIPISRGGRLYSATGKVTEWPSKSPVKRGPSGPGADECTTFGFARGVDRPCVQEIKLPPARRSRPSPHASLGLAEGVVDLRHPMTEQAVVPA